LIDRSTAQSKARIGIRETLNRRPQVWTGVSVGVCFVALSFVFWRGSSAGPATKAFFTVDDGQTYFVDSATQVAPFQHDGREAVQCYVFTCSKEPFVGYLLKYSPNCKVELEKAHALGAKIPPLNPTDIFVKKPGDKVWVLAGSSAGTALTQVRCPNTQDQMAEMVLP